VADLLTKDEARRSAANVAKLRNSWGSKEKYRESRVEDSTPGSVRVLAKVGSD